MAHTLPRRDRLAILSGLLGISLLAWAYLIYMAAGMERMTADSLLRLRPWGTIDFALMFVMWAVMMVGMMVPTAIPMTMIYAAVARKAQGQGAPLAPAAIFVSGYVVVWTGFSLAATFCQWILDQAALLSPMMVTNSPALGALLLIGAGVYQMTPAKNACLRHCRAPAHFFASQWLPGRWGAFRLGLVHGAYCLGCCWILIGLLFVGGVMNLLWIGAITAFVLLEKVLPFGDLGGRLAGVAMIVLGLLVLIGG